MLQTQGTPRVGLGLFLALGLAAVGAFVAFGSGDGERSARTESLATEAELAARQGWLAAQGHAQKLARGAGGPAEERTTRTAEHGAGIVVAPDGTPVPGATLVLSTRSAASGGAVAVESSSNAVTAELPSVVLGSAHPVTTEIVVSFRHDVVANLGSGGWKVRTPQAERASVPAVPPWTVVRTWKADADGRFALEELPAGELLLDAHDGQRTLVEPLTRSEVESAPASGLRLALVPGHVVEGLVRDGAGLPLAGVEVSCRAVAWDDGRIDPLELRQALTDASGTYRIPGLRSGARYQLGFVREHYFSAAEPELLEVRRDEKLDHVLTEHATLAGTVLEGGVPQAEVEVELRGFGVEKSDAAGRFRFRPRLDAQRTLELFARSADQRFSGYLSVELGVAAKRDDVVLPLERACLVRGRVVDETGRGVGGASVALQWEERASEAMEAGSIRWGNQLGLSRELLLGQVAEFQNVRIQSHAGFRTQLVPRAVSGIRSFQEVQVEPRPISLALDSDGKLVSFLSDMPVLGGRGDRSGGPARIFMPRRTVEADMDGRYEFLGVWPGSYRVSASHPEHLAGEDRACALAPGDEREVDLVLPRGAKVAGVVLDAEGSPAANATVIAVRAGEEQQRVQVDERGRFAMVGLSPGELDLVASAEDGGGNTTLRGLALANGSDIPDLALRLGAGAGLFGRVVDGMGAPIAGASVTLSSKLASSSQHEVESGADGSYRVERALHGEHRLQAQAAGYLPFEQDGLVLDGMLRRDLRLERGASIAGRIYGADGAPLPGALIFLFHGERESQSSADGEGRFHFNGLQPGRLEVYVRAQDYGESVRASRELALGEEVAGFDLRMKRSGVVRGVVRDAAGKPVAGVEVSGLTEPGGKGRREATTGNDGRFELRSLYPDHYRIYAKGDPGKGLVVDARAGGELEEIELLLAR